MSDAVPGQARVVVIGGGIAGCSVAYHLAKLGWRDVVLLERRELSCGTTWHAAGLVGQLRATHNLTRLAKYGADLYERLEAETGQATGFRRPGSLSLARTTERMHELARLASMARCFDVDAEVITPAEAGRRWPLLRTDDLAGAVWLPRDGRTNPIDTTLALAKGARQGGVTILENTAVTAIRTRGGAVAGVGTSRGDIACEVVVNCAGMWARDLGAMAGVAVPLHASEHFYIVTEPMDGVTADLPVLRDPDGHIYVREEVGGLLMGGFEPVAKPWGMEGIPADFAFSLLPEDWDHFQVLMEQAIVRIPAIESAPVRSHVNGPESFTPDGRYHLGEAPECRNFFVAAGFNSIGIASGAGAGKAVAEWIVGGEPRWTSGTWTSAAWRHFRRIPRTCERAPWRWSAACTPCTGPSSRPRRRAACGRACSMTGSPRAAPASAKSSAGSARTGTRRRARSLSIAIAGAARTGSRGPPRSIARCARPWGSSISRRSPS